MDAQNVLDCTEASARNATTHRCAAWLLAANGRRPDDNVNQSQRVEVRGVLYSE